MRCSIHGFILLLTLFVALSGNRLARAETVIVPGENLHVVIDVDYCDQPGTVVCGGTGSLAAAATSNDSAVVMIVQVKANNGNAVGGLALTDFTLDAVLSPGGVALVIVNAATCPSCFSELPTGTYRLAVRPGFGNWIAGTHIAHLEVSSGGSASARTVIPITIEP